MDHASALFEPTPNAGFGISNEVGAFCARKSVSTW
jgi:hypothetical protein